MFSTPLIRAVALLACCFFLPLAVAAQETDADLLLIRDVTVIDGTGANGVSGLDVLVRGGLIESVHATSSDTTFSGRVIDGTGRFLVPGLIDAHLHVSGRTRDEASLLLRWLVEGGVTSLRDMAGDARDLAGLQRALLVGELTGPSLYYSALVAGPAFMSDPRVKANMIGYAEGEAPYMVPITPESDLVRTIAMIKGTGATGVKLYAALDASLVRAITSEAHRAGLQVWAHSTVFPAKPIEIIEAGVDAVSHAAYLVWEAAPASEDFTERGRGDFARVPADGAEMERVIDAMVRNQTVLDPTLMIFQQRDETEEDSRRARWGNEFTRRAHEAGVRIAAGTDRVGEPLAGELPAVHGEMSVLVDQVGLTPLEALSAATLGGAYAIGIQDEVGSIRSGKVADLLLLSADPSVDIRNTRAIVHVIRAGNIIR